MTVAASVSTIIHALHNQPLDPTTIYLLTFLAGIVLGNTSTVGNGNGTLPEKTP